MILKVYHCEYLGLKAFRYFDFDRGCGGGKVG